MLTNVDRLEYVFVVVMACVNMENWQALPQKPVDKRLQERMKHYCGLYSIPHKVELGENRLVVTSGGRDYIEAENMLKYLQNSQYIFAEEYNNELCACFGKIYRSYGKREQSYQEASFLMGATQHFLSKQTDWTKHVSLFELLWKCMDGELLERFCKERLQGLLDEAKKSKLDLLDNLKVYVRTGFNIKETARQLDMPRNTLDYRLNKIKKIMNLNREDGFAWAEVMLALLIKEYLDSELYKNHPL